MAAKKIRKKKSAAEMELGHPMHRIATYLEQTRLADYMDLMQRPGKLAWLNFWAGVWRAFGFVIGGALFIALFVWGLKYAYIHAGGLPWVGENVEQAIAWILSVIDKRQGGS